MTTAVLHTVLPRMITAETSDFNVPWPGRVDACQLTGSASPYPSALPIRLGCCQGLFLGRKADERATQKVLKSQLLGGARAPAPQWPSFWQHCPHLKRSVHITWPLCSGLGPQCLLGYQTGLALQSLEVPCVLVVQGTRCLAQVFCFLGVCKPPGRW